MNTQALKEHLEQLTGETRQNKIAEKIHISPSKINKWFSGKLRPTLDDLLILSETYHCSIDWLIGNEYKEKEIDYLSVFDVCKRLIEFDRLYFLKIDLLEVKEKTTFYDDESDDGMDGEITKEFIEKLPVFYIPNAVEENEIWRSEYGMEDQYRNMKLSALAYSNRGIYFDTNKEINNFVMKYIKIKKMYLEDVIDMNTFHQIINGFLNELSKEPMDPLGLKKNFTLINEFDSDMDLEEATKEYFASLKVKNAMNDFCQRNNITFLTNDQADSNV